VVAGCGHVTICAQDASDKRALSVSNFAIQNKLDIANAKADSAAGTLATMQSELATLDEEAKDLTKTPPSQPLSPTVHQQVLTIQSHIAQINSLMSTELIRAAAAKAAANKRW
jgi:hypothetical protein